MMKPDSYFIFDELHNDTFSTLDEEGKQLLLFSLANFQLYFRHTISLPANLSYGLEIEFVSLMLQKASFFIQYFRNWNVAEEERNIITFLKNGILFGGEVTTPKCFDQSKYWQDIEEVLQFLKINGAEINDFCGGHIHIGKNILEDNHLYLERFIKLWIIFENVIYRFGNRFSTSGRTYQSHAARICGPALYAYLDYHTKALHINHFFRERKYFKLSSLSFSDFQRLDGTIEFRNPDGTLDSEIWQTRVLFFAFLLLSVKNEQNDFDAIERMIRSYNADACSYQNFAQFDFDQSLFLADFIFHNNLDKAMFLKCCIKDETVILKKEKNYL